MPSRARSAIPRQIVFIESNQDLTRFTTINHITFSVIADAMTWYAALARLIHFMKMRSSIFHYSSSHCCAGKRVIDRQEFRLAVSWRLCDESSGICLVTIEDVLDVRWWYWMNLMRKMSPIFAAFWAILAVRVNGYWWFYAPITHLWWWRRNWRFDYAFAYLPAWRTRKYSIKVTSADSRLSRYVTVPDEHLSDMEGVE